LSKIVDYLVDNIYALMLSQVMAELKRKVRGLRTWFPNWDSPGENPAQASLDEPPFKIKEER